MLDTMAQQLLAESENFLFIYYIRDISTYMFNVHNALVTLNVRQSPAVIYDSETLSKLLDSKLVTIDSMDLKDTALNV